MKPVGDDETCYVCYGLHYLNGKMRMNGEKAKCVGFSVKTEPNVALIEKSRKLDMSLKPGITLYSFGRAYFTGKMHRQGTPPFCIGIQFTLVKDASGKIQPDAIPNNRASNEIANQNFPKQPKASTEEVKLSPEEQLLRLRDIVIRSEEKLLRSFQTSFASTVDDLPGKVVRSTGKFIRSAINTGSMLTNYVLKSVGWK